MINLSSQGIVHSILVILVIAVLGVIGWLKSRLNKAEGEVRNADIQEKVDRIEENNKNTPTRDLLKQFDDDVSGKGKS
jgi:hypothetical protein